MKVRQFSLALCILVLAAGMAWPGPAVARNHPGPKQTPTVSQGGPIVPPTVPPQRRRVLAGKLGKAPGN